MIFRNLFKPKWQHSDPEVRREALAGLDPAQEEAAAIMVQMAREDASAALRQAAVKRLLDVTVVLQIAQNDSDDAVKGAAQKRFLHLLAGNIGQGPSLDRRIELLTQVDDTRTLEYVAQKGDAAKLRHAALTRVEREPVLLNVAANDPDAEVRAAALEKITQRSTLERLVKETRTRDKHISRLAKEKLEALIEAEEMPERIRHQRRKICIVAETLLNSEEWHRNEMEFARLEEEWRSFALPPDEDLATRYEQTRQRLLATLEEHRRHEAQRLEQEQQFAPMREERETICRTLEGVLLDLQGRDNLAASDAALVDSALSINDKAWQQTAALPAAEQQAFAARYKRVRDLIQEQRNRLTVHQQTLATMEKLCARAEALLNKKAVSETQISELEQAWNQPDRPEGEAAEQCRGRYQSALDALHKLVAQQKAARETQLEQLKTSLQRLEIALDEGELASAEEAQRQAQDAVAQLGERAPRKQRQRLQAAAHRVHELRNWRNWAATPKKESLIADMEALAGSSEPPTEIARLVQEARDAWKNLGPTDPANAKALWERFNQACTAAYEPAAAYFQEEAQQRKGNQAAREAFLDKLESFAREADWQHVDWKKVERLQQQARDEWRTFGPTDRKAAKQLGERFKSALDTLHQHLEEEWAGNVLKRQGLIKQVRELAELDDVHAAVEQAKQLQQAWKDSGRVSPKQERTLWKEFRAGCDEVFARRKAEFDARDAGRRAATDHRRALCEEVETLSALAGDALKQAEGQVRQAENAWREIPAGDKRQDNELDQRFRRAVKQFHQARTALSESREQQQLDLLRQKGLLCAQLEAMGEKAAPAEIESIKTKWAALPALDKAEESAIQTRLDQALAALDDHGVTEAQLADNLAAKEQLCIRMEILTGVESPAEAAQARMAYQVERLSRAMGQGGADDRKQRERERLGIEREWQLIGPVPADRGAALEARFEKARGASKTTATA